jgi:hypothetical protein
MYVWFVFVLSVMCLSGLPNVSSAQTSSGSMSSVIGESLLGDVYEPSRWRELSLGTLFSDGWDEP